MIKKTYNMPFLRFHTIDPVKLAEISREMTDRPHSRHFQKQYQKPVGRSVDGGRRGLILKENNSQIG